MDIAQIRATILFISAFISFIFFVILLFQGKSKTTLHLSLLALFGGVYAFIFGGSYLFDPKVLWVRACWLGVLIIPSYLSFLYYFTGRIRHIKLKIFLWYLAAIIIIILALATPYFVIRTIKEYPWTAINGPLIFLGRIFVIIGVITGFFYLFTEYSKSTGVKKTQLKYLILGFVLYGLIGVLAAGLIPLFYPKFTYIDISALAPFFWIAINFYAISQRRLFGIKVILTELLVIIIATILLIQFFLAGTLSLKIISFIIFIIFLFIGYLLIRATQKEIENKEKAESLAEELKKLTETLEEKVKERTKELEEAKTTLEVKVKARTKELEELTETLEEKVKEKTKGLQEKIAELERFHKLTVGRELKMIELKKKIKELEKELG